VFMLHEYVYFVKHKILKKTPKAEQLWGSNAQIGFIASF
jgi:hypothetical protein